MQPLTSGQPPSGTTNQTTQSTSAQAGSTIPSEPASQLDIERLKLVKWVTIIGIVTIAAIIIAVLILAGFGKLGAETVPVIAMITTGIGVIGTIIGSVVGHAQGATGREAEAKARTK